MSKRWDNYFIEMSYLIASQSKCLRRKVGSVLVDKNNIVVATGYNGKPYKTKCDNICFRENLKPGENQTTTCCLHSEFNTFLFSERSKYQKGTLYCTCPPCEICAAMIAQSGISRLVIPKVDIEYSGKQYLKKIFKGSKRKLTVIEYKRK